jgi:hypothetical protein
VLSGLRVARSISRFPRHQGLAPGCPPLFRTATHRGNTKQTVDVDVLARGLGGRGNAINDLSGGGQEDDPQPQCRAPMQLLQLVAQLVAKRQLYKLPPMPCFNVLQTRRTLDPTHTHTHTQQTRMAHAHVTDTCTDREEEKTLTHTHHAQHARPYTPHAILAHECTRPPARSATYLQAAHTISHTL